jgi:N-methylhydantoinase A
VEAIAAEVEALRDSLSEGIEGAVASVTYELRYRGQAFELPVQGPENPDPDDLAERFASEHERRYGYRDPDAPVELVNVRLALNVPGPSPHPTAASAAELGERSRRARFEGEWLEARVLRGEPAEGLESEGPCVFELPEATLVLPRGWTAMVDEHGTIMAAL